MSFQTPHPNIAMRPLHLQARCLWPGDDQEGTCKTRHSPVLSHSHFCFPSACHQAFHFPITYKITKKNYYRKLCNGKGFCRIHNSKSHFFFLLRTSSVQLALIGDSFQRKYVCGSKISRFLVNCQKDFFSSSSLPMEKPKKKE